MQQRIIKIYQDMSKDECIKFLQDLDECKEKIEEIVVRRNDIFFDGRQEKAKHFFTIKTEDIQ